jgi:thiosulfate reductase cytochrome b subunit
LAARFASISLWLGGRAIPIAICVVYAVLISQWWGASAGGFGSLDEIEKLFSVRGLLLAGWVHYLAFDLWVGRWQVDFVERVADDGRLPSWLIRVFAIPCLLLTFIFGPIGLLLFLALILLHGNHLRASGSPYIQPRKSMKDRE